MCIATKVDQKNNFNFVCFGCATQNKAMDMKELV